MKQIRKNIKFIYKLNCIKILFAMIPFIGLLGNDYT